MDIQTVAIMVNFLLGIAGVVGLIIAWKKLKPESMQLNGAASESYATAAKETAELYRQSLAEFKQLKEERIKDNRNFQNEIDHLRAELDQNTIKLAKFENWASRLCAQITSLGKVPVPVDIEPI